MTFPGRVQVAFALQKTGCQLLFQDGQLADFLANRADLGAQQVAHMGASFALVALQDEQLANLRERETQLLGAANEVQAVDVFGMEQAKSAFGPRWAFEELLLFVKPDGVDSQAGLL